MSNLILEDDGTIRDLQHSTVREAVIKENESLSNVIDLRGYRNVALLMPDEWTTANITLQGSDKEDGDFKDVHDDGGNEVLFEADGDRLIILAGQATDMPDSMSVLSPLRYVKLRSGTSGTAVTQGADRTIKVLLGR